MIGKNGFQKSLKIRSLLLLCLVYSSVLGGFIILPVSGAEDSTIGGQNTWRSPNSYLNPLLCIPTEVYDFELYEDFVIIGADNGIQIYPLQEIQNVSKVTTIPLPGAVIDILIIQDILIALCDGFGVAGINLQELEGEINPIYLELDGDLNNVVGEGGYLYVSCGDQGIATVQMSQIEGDISEFSLISIFLLDNLSVYDIAIENGKLFSITRQIDAHWSYHLVIIDYIEPSQLVLYESLSLGFFIGGINVINSTVYYWDTLDRGFVIGTFDTQNNFTYQNHLYLYSPIKDIAFVDEIAYMALGSAGFGFMNVSDYEDLEQPSIVPLNDVALKIKVSGKKAYVLIGSSNSEFNIQIIDLSDPYIKTYTEVIETIGHLEHMFIKDTIAYIESGYDFQIYDIGDPMHPELLSTIDANASILDIKTDGNELYISNYDNEILIFNITSLINPLFISNITLSQPAWDIEISEGYAYLANHGEGLTVINITNPETPQIVTSVQLSDETGWAREIALQNNFAYLACGNGGFEIIDITNPVKPTSVSVLETYGNAANLEIRNSIVYLSHSWGDFVCINVSNPFEPQIISHCGLNGVFTFYNDELYILHGPNWLYRLNITDLSDISIIDRIKVSLYDALYNLLNIHEGIIYYGDGRVWYQFNYTSYILNFDRTEICSSIGKISTWEISDKILAYTIGNSPYVVIKPIQDEGSEIKWVIPIEKSITSIVIQENRVYLAYGINELFFVDLSSDGSKLEIREISSSETITNIILYNDVIFEHNGSTLCNILKDDGLTTVEWYGNFTIESNIVNMIGYSNQLFIQTENHKVLVYDISNPIDPNYTGEVDLGYSTNDSINEIIIENNHLFIQFYDKVSIYKIENPMLPEYVNYHFVNDFSEFVVIENYIISLTGSGYILSVVKFSNSYKQGDFYYNFILENKFLSLKSRSGKICLLSSNYQFWEFDFQSWIQFNIFSNWLIYGCILAGIAVIIIYKLLKNRKYNKQLF